MLPGVILTVFWALPLNVNFVVPSLLPLFNVTIKEFFTWVALSAVPAVAGLPINTFWGSPLRGVTVNDPSVPFANT